MKKSLTLVLVMIVALVFGQKEISSRYSEAYNLLQEEKLIEAYSILKEIEPVCNRKNSLYNHILWNYATVTAELERQCRMNEEFEASLKYGLEALELIRKGKKRFDEDFAARAYWMHKNLIVSCFGLGQLDEAQKHRAILYQAYYDKVLPDGINEYFNFSFFRWEGKNIWGYEWFEDLPKDRNSKSFTKIVYYVYSTNADGSDKEQLFRLHVLMFHKLNNAISFDYVLTKIVKTAEGEVSRTLYDYTYNEEIDFAQLQSDIKEVLKGNDNPDSKSTIRKE